MSNPFNFEASVFEFTNDTIVGDDSPQSIRRLQQTLNRALGLQLPLDGVMGFRTRRAVRDLQRRKGTTAARSFPPGNGLSKQNEFGETNAELSFGSPLRAARPVRANFVSCNPPSAAIAAITGPNPVATIQAANTRAIELLDFVINQLQEQRRRIRAGESTAIVPNNLRQALRTTFRMDANNRTIWTSQGSRSIYVLIRRFRGSRQILADGWMKYTCLGARAPATVTIARGGTTCTVRGCEGERAFTCGGNSRIVLCEPWWREDLGVVKIDAQSWSLTHESFHIYFGFIGDQEAGNFANAHCYAQFVLQVNGLPVPSTFVSSCP